VFNKLKPKSEFSRNILTLMTGTTIAQAIPISISPILTRIYTPEDFGVFALYASITMIFGVVVTGRYELALMLPEKDEDAINIFALGFILTVLISLVLLVIVLIFNENIVRLLKNSEIEIWLYFAPISVFLIGMFNLLNYFNNRKKHYKDIAKATVIKSIILSIIQLTIGFIKTGAAGLVTGQIISQIFSNIKLAKNIYKDKKLISSINKEDMLKLGKRYIKFPKFSMLAELINSLSYNLLTILISLFFSIKVLGYYSLVYKILSLPSSLIGNSISQVYYQEASKELRNSYKIIISFNHVFLKLLVSIPIFIVLYFIIEDAFIIVFGNDWSESGIYAKILLPLFFIRFISSALSSTMSL